MTELRKGYRNQGYLDIEEKAHSGNFVSSFFHLDRQSKKLSYYRCEKQAYKDVNPGEPDGVIDMNYVSQVNCSRSIRPKILHCFAITVSGEKVFVKAKNQEEKDEWIKSLSDISKIIVPLKRASTISQTSETNAEDVYETTVVGGVVVRRKLLEEEEYSSSCEELNHWYSPQDVIKTGYCIKQGYLMKSWKRRYFVLDSYGLTYFKSEQDKVPLRVVGKFTIIEARVSRGVHPTRENLFEVVTGQRVFYIQAQDITEMHSWIDEINRLIQGRTKTPVEQSCQTSPSLTREVSDLKIQSSPLQNVSMSGWL